MKQKLASAAIVTSLALSGCNRALVLSPADLAAQQKVLLETDRAFARLSVSQGAAAAFDAFLADDATSLDAGQVPTHGRCRRSPKIEQTRRCFFS
jgi:hypothetical protein